jgi:D-beta-D-heptose 7-phosphate kinase/D-beta-D-heptose 1-phosphate adenosyltransferase
MEELISRFSETKVLVIGDPILDIYLRGYTTRISREAPVPVFDVSDEEALCGGAANAAMNLTALGASTWLATVTGNDAHADTIISLLQGGHVNLSSLVRDKRRATVVKQRVTAENNILLRIDRGDITPIDAEIENELMRRISIHWDSADVIILSDYDCGIITERIIGFIADVMEHLPKPIIVDAKDPSKFAKLQPSAVKPNYQEAVSMLNIPPVPRTQRAEQMVNSRQELFRLTGASSICVTLDKDGVILLKSDGSHHRILCIPFDNRNAIGAGDTFSAAFSLAIANGASPEDASHIAANAAAVVVQKEATAPRANCSAT